MECQYTKLFNVGETAHGAAASFKIKHFALVKQFATLFLWEYLVFDVQVKRGSGGK
jgi:hypothetical protein